MKTASVFLFLAALRCASAQTPAVLNLSHDLVAKGIAKSDMIPNSPTLDSRPLFEAGINYASANHIPTVIADRGSYYFLTQNTTYRHTVLFDISNVTVDLQYSDLYFAHGNIIGMQILNCTNVTLKNFTLDYLQLPFTQLTVTGVDAASKTIRFKQLGNYPLPSTFNNVTLPSFYVDDGFFLFAFRNGQELRTTGRMQAAGPFNDSSVQITGTQPWASSAAVGSIQPGDTLVFTHRAGVGTIYSSFSTGLAVQNVSIYSSGFIGVNLGFGVSNTVDRVQVIPRPGTDRLISTNADGIHLSHSGANNTVTNNTVKRTCDDALAIDGEWSAIVNAANTGPTVQVARNSDSPLTVGTSFDFINYTNATIVGTATIVAISPPPAQQTNAGGELLTVTLDHTVSVQQNYGMTPSDPLLRGSGTVFRGNLVQEGVFARGVYPAGVANVTVADNLIESTNGVGVLVEQDEALAYGYKTGPSSGITISNNIIDNALGYGVPSYDLLSEAAAINVVAYNQIFQWVSTMPFSGINVTGNFVTNTVRTGVRLENVNGGAITGNTVLNYGTQPTDYLWFLPGCCETQAQIQSDFAQPAVVLTSAGVSNTNNTTTGIWVANVSDADGGYRLAPNSIAAAYGQNIGPATAALPGTTLPTTLGGVSVSVKDSAGASRLAPLYYAGQNQINYVVPAATAPGVATVTIGKTVSAALVGTVGPGLFTEGGKVAAALAIRASASGAQVAVPVFSCGSSGCSTVPMDLGASTDILVLELYGTGIRGRSSLTNVVATIGGVPAQIVYADAQPQFSGLDQVNIYVPRSLAGAGEVPVVLTVDGTTANVVTVNVK